MIMILVLKWPPLFALCVVAGLHGHGPGLEYGPEGHWAWLQGPEGAPQQNPSRATWFQFLRAVLLVARCISQLPSLMAFHNT